MCKKKHLDKEDKLRKLEQKRERYQWKLINLTIKRNFDLKS